ncbi:MAG TPA: amidohydrolase family protein [Candidatus Sulfotelmatobacter sp.]|nr:amidohydrolase family protein [Candidatus Sulfotelmatobacter sp.]
MTAFPFRGARRAWTVLLGVLLAGAALSPLRSSLALAETPRVHAIVGARIVTAPGQVIEHGTIVMRDGLITAVGASVPIPADARVWNAESLTVYPGLIDAYVVPAPPSAPMPNAPPAGPPGRRAPPPPSPPRGPASELGCVTPEVQVIRGPGLGKDQLEALRAAGFAAVRLAPGDGVVRGRSAVVGLGDGPANGNTLREDDAQVMALQPVAGTYPGSLMGAIAVIRQSFLDARWYRDARAAWAKKPAASERPQTNLSWEALQPVIEGKQPVLFVTDDMLEVLRAGTIAKEAGVAAQVLTAGDEYKRIADVTKVGLPLVVPVSFPDAPDVSTDDAALEVETETLRHWQNAPGNAAALAKAGITFSLTANGLKDVKQFRSNVARAMRRGLTEAQALASVTTVPARMLGLDQRLGTLAPGKIANLTVTRGNLFSDQGKVREIWVDGNRYETQKDETTPQGEWKIDWGHGHGSLVVVADRDTTVKVVVGADTIRASAVRLEEHRLRFTARQGGGPIEDFDLTAREDALSGTLVAQGVGSHAVTGRAIKKEAKAPREEKRVPAPQVAGDPEACRASMPAQASAVLVRGATLWTAGPQGNLDDADLLIKGGKIAAIGRNLTAPGGAVVIDGHGKCVAPGIIDEHSHSAILGNVNECTRSVTCEVRIQDVVNSESPNIYRQLASGNTIMHLLHGSCNPIGGQCAVIKNKWGEAPDQLIFAAAPGTVKFALGENVKQSNSQPSTRYPQTRAGVEQTMRDAFIRGRDYQAAWAEFKKGKRPLPPRKDLQLEAISEILDGKRLVHCHSYRQDEILMLMRLAESFNFRINTFTHILEGYKVADEMATHGASGLGFTDWWAYKFEVYDAIPWNVYIMWDRGVNVGFNSDSDELARRLNTEAGKAVKYGGVPEAEAIKFVTLNAAKSLLIADRVGSLEVGKDADFAIWSGSPLSMYSVCEQTWIEGRKYFDRAADLAGRDALAKERAALISAARAAKKEGGDKGGRGNWTPRYLENSDLSGNDCSTDEAPFMSEAERRMRLESQSEGSEVQR